MLEHQESEPVLVVTGKNGWRGIIEGTSPAGQMSTPHILVRLGDGRQVLVPTEALVLQADGAYHLPLTLAELEHPQEETRSAPAPAADQTRTVPGTGREEFTVPVVAETARVEKRTVETGRVRIRKTVQEREEVVDEPLLREEVSVERIPVGRVVAEPVGMRQEGDTFIIPVLEEVLVVEKRLLLKEEVRVTRRQRETHQPQRVTLKTEEVMVERIAGADSPQEHQGD